MIRTRSLLCHDSSMKPAHLQVKNVPLDLYERLRSMAARRGSTMRDVVLAALERELAYEGFRERLRDRAPVELARSVGELVSEVREERLADLGKRARVRR